MAKPICVIKVTRDIYEQTSFNKLNDIYSDRLPDYHVFVVPAKYTPEEPQEPIQFHVFYEKDFTETDYSGLKELINSALN